MEPVQALHAVTDPTRCQLLQLLLQHHYCVKALAKKLGISESAVSQHMRVLRQCGVVTGVKLGYQVHYQIDQQRLAALFDETARQLAGRPPQKALPLGERCHCEFSAQCIQRKPKHTGRQPHAE